MTKLSPARRLKDLAAAAMLGTDRAGAAAKAGELLTQAAVLGAQARAGFKPRLLAGRMAPCPADPRSVAGAAPMATLMRLLSEPDVGLITEWSELASARQVRVADSAVPVLLDWWSRQPRRPEVVWSVLGKRGEWLASQNPSWRKRVAGSEIPSDADEIWQTGKTPERVALLLTIRRHDAARALALIQSTWKSDGADEHRRFIEVLREGCSIADEPFLETALDDKSKLVRRAAAAVLSLIPNSRFKRRMNERARQMIAMNEKRGAAGRGAKVVLTPPKEFDVSWERDGVESQAASAKGQRAWWLRQILSAADLSVWTDALELDPAGVLACIGEDDYFGDALDAMSAAAERGGDAAWSTAIVRCRLQDKKVDIRAIDGLWRNLRPEDREALLLETADHKRFTLAERLQILASTGTRWSRPFSGAALKLLNKESQSMGVVWSLHEAVDLASRSVAPEFAEQFAETVTKLVGNEPTESFKRSIDRVRLRADMHKEFAS